MPYSSSSSSENVEPSPLQQYSAVGGGCGVTYDTGTGVGSGVTANSLDAGNINLGNYVPEDSLIVVEMIFKDKFNFNINLILVLI